MDVKLHLTKGNPKGKTVDVPAGILKVGRAEDSDLIIASTRVSRHHCEIANDQDRLVIRDNGSANGTFVNRQKIQEQALQPGDQVQVGPLTFIVEINGVRKRPSSPPAQQPAKSSAKPVAPAARPSKPAAPKLPPVQRRRGPEDIASTLERLAGGKQPGPSKPKNTKKDADILQISDDDLLKTEE
jgi:pSer/pThr/pTyr-binding forkhead associated (FHA) protein